MEHTPKHTADDAVPPGRRAFRKQELQGLFDYLDDQVDLQHAANSKHWLSLYRDSIAFKLCYAYGLRRRELTLLDLHDFGVRLGRADASGLDGRHQGTEIASPRPTARNPDEL